MVDRARQGDRTAFDRLSGEIQPGLERHVRARIGKFLESRVEVEDVLQETWVRAWKSIPSFRGAGEEVLKRWFKEIAERAILDLASRNRRDRIIYVEAPHDQPGSQLSPSQAMRRGERLARLQEALDSLSPEYREAVIPVRLQGMKVKEAAERMGRTPKAVMHLLLRAMKKLKDAFGDTESLHLPPGQLDKEGGAHEK